MLEEGLVRKLVELQKSEMGGVLMDVRGENKNIERHPFESYVARFAVQLEVGEGLIQREKREMMNLEMDLDLGNLRNDRYRRRACSCCAEGR
ncbi:hypothetical protein LXL04_035919 [Taraxacum kok-saghyz]